MSHLYGKVFGSLYEGSMLGAGVHVFALWPYCLARADARGVVEVNPNLAAVVLGCSVTEIEQALEYLQRPDPDSRSREEEGRRLVREGQFAYRIVNYLRYREIRDAEARREYQREWVKGKRANRRKSTKVDGRQVSTKSTKGEGEGEGEGKEEGESSAPARRPSPASLLETWNRERGPLPEAKGLSGPRERHARTRLGETPDLERWAAAVRRIARSPFCLGSNDRGWRATFDWLLQPDTLLKVEEGKFDPPWAIRVLPGAHPPRPASAALREVTAESPEWVREVWRALGSADRPDVPDELAAAVVEWRERNRGDEEPDGWRAGLEAAWDEVRRQDAAGGRR